MIPEGWQRALMAEMDRRFEIYRTNKRHDESLCIDDTQIGVEFAIDFIKQQLAAAPTPPAQHSDDEAVDRFAQAMKLKLAEKRAQGYGGWGDESRCPIEFLQKLLVSHIRKGDPVDVGNFAMMLHQRGGSTTPPAQEAVKPDAAVAAIKFALDNDGGSEARAFLDLWLHGDFAAIRREWDNVPDEVFIGADPLFTRRES